MKMLFETEEGDEWEIVADDLPSLLSLLEEAFCEADLIEKTDSLEILNEEERKLINY